MALFLVIMTAYVMFEKKKPDRIVNIDKEKYEINSLHVYSCYYFIPISPFVCVSTLLSLASERHIWL
jgi:hypothetical protein